jgi:hypothetical protein
MHQFLQVIVLLQVYDDNGNGQCYSNRHCCGMMPGRIGGFYNAWGLGKNFSVKLVLNKILIKLRQELLNYPS